jgi:hypothetical protein
MRAVLKKMHPKGTGNIKLIIPFKVAILYQNGMVI